MPDTQDKGLSVAEIEAVIVKAKVNLMNMLMGKGNVPPDNVFIAQAIHDALPVMPKCASCGDPITLGYCENCRPDIMPRVRTVEECRKHLLGDDQPMIAGKMSKSGEYENVEYVRLDKAIATLQLPNSKPKRTLSEGIRAIREEFGDAFDKAFPNPEQVGGEPK